MDMKIRGKCSRGGLRSHFENRSGKTLCRKKEEHRRRLRRKSLGKTERQKGLVTRVI
jgi:hypothetical protein